MAGKCAGAWSTARARVMALTTCSGSRGMEAADKWITCIQSFKKDLSLEKMDEGWMSIGLVHVEV